jgi:dihydroorotate dehydrogenase electron transfer subunit
MVAGGVGLAPFAALGASLRTRGVRTTLFYGARRHAELFYLDLFKSLGIDLVLTTEDGSAGERGRIAAPLERQLAALDRAHPLMIYACGPEGMLAACARLAARFGRPCQVSVERVMGCGMGGCYSCVVPMRADEPPPRTVAWPTCVTCRTDTRGVIYPTAEDETTEESEGALR